MQTPQPSGTTRWPSKPASPSDGNGPGAAAPTSATPRWQAAAHALRTWVPPKFDMRLAIVHERPASVATLPAALACSD